MTQWLKQSTATDRKIGPFNDDTDGKTDETGLTTAYTLIYLSKNGGALTAKHETTAIAHDALGYYLCKLDSTDTNTLGSLKVATHVAGHLPVWQEFMVVPANVWDSFFGASLLGIDVVNWKGSAAAAMTGDAFAAVADVHATDLPAVKTVADAIAAKTTNLPASPAAVGSAMTLTSPYDAAKTAAAPGAKMDLIDAPNATALSTMATAVWAATTRTLSGFGTLAADAATAVWGAVTRSLTDKTGYSGTATNMVAAAPDAAAVNAACDIAIADAALATAAGLATVDANVDAILTDTGTTLDAAITALPTDADVQTAAAAALTAYDPPTRAEATTDKEAIVTAMPAAAPLATANASAVRTNLATELGRVDAAISSRLATAGYTAPPSIAALATEANAAANKNAVIAALPAAAPAASAVADAVWNEASADHTGVGSTGKALTDAPVASIDLQPVLDAIAAIDVSGLSVNVDLTPLTDAAALIQASLGAAHVTVISPVGSGGAITICAGDDYAAEDNRAVSFTVPVAGLPDLTGGRVRLKFTQGTWEASSVSGDALIWVFAFTPGAEETAALTLARQSYELEATTADDRVLTLAKGSLVTVPDIPAVS